MTATSQNQINPIALPSLLNRYCRFGMLYRLNGGSRLNLFVDKHNEECGENRVQPHKPEQRKQAVTGADILREAHFGAHKSEHDPRLTADFRGHPPGCIGNVWQRET